jgi:hypothetical protein
VLVNLSGPPQHIRREVFDRVHGNTTTDQLQPLHVPSLRTSQRQNTVLGQHIQTQRVNSLLVDDDKSLGRIVTAHLLFQLHNLPQLLVYESPLALDELFALLGGGVEESGVDLGLLVLKGHVEDQDVGVLDMPRHVGVAGTVVQSKTPDQLRLGGGSVLHLHDLDHVQVGLSGGVPDGKNGIDDAGC